MSKAQTLKSLVKKDPKPSFGSDPSDPWTTKSNMMNETALLNRYLKSRGINPEFATKDMKVAHSKTNAFKVWLKAHEDLPEETMTSMHTPTAKRAHILKRSLHVGKEIRTTDGGHKNLHSEEVEQIDEISNKSLQSYRQAAHTQIQHHKFGAGKDKPEASKVLSKREPGMARATAKVIQKQKELIAKSPKREPEKVVDKYPLGGYDPVSGRSYSEEFQTEAVDKKDTVTFDIPLLIRVLEFAREDLKSDVLLHKMVERLINLRRKGTLTMNQYGKIVKEEVEQLDELQKSTLLSYATKAREHAKGLSKQGDRTKKVSTKYEKYKKATMRYAGAAKAEKKSFATEDTFQDTYAATQTSFDGGNSPAEEPTTTSNAKRIIKDVYKKKRGLKEDLYDHEKEDKSVAGYGKKPKVQKETTGKLQAAAVLSGGTTLTGQKRDTVEIDPMMKMKPGQQQKQEVR